MEAIKYKTKGNKNISTSSYVSKIKRKENKNETQTKIGKDKKTKSDDNKTKSSTIESDQIQNQK